MSTDLKALSTAVLRRAAGRALPLTELREALASEGLEVGAAALRRALEEQPARFHLTEAPDPFAAAWGWTAPQRDAYTTALRESGAGEPVRVFLVDPGEVSGGDPASLCAADALDASVARLWARTRQDASAGPELAAALMEARALRAALEGLTQPGGRARTDGEDGMEGRAGAGARRPASLRSLEVTAAGAPGVRPTTPPPRPRPRA